jgi:uncharacterized protein with FMN-binding domain
MKGSTRKRIAAATLAAVLGISGTAATAAGTTLASLRGGAFTGRREYAYYGYVKVQAIVQNGSLSDIRVLEYPNDNGRSHYINTVALPYLIQEVVGAKSWKVDLVSGATFTSVAFLRSLQDALKQAGA